MSPIPPLVMPEVVTQMQNGIVSTTVPLWHLFSPALWWEFGITLGVLTLLYILGNVTGAFHWMYKKIRGITFEGGMAVARGEAWDTLSRQRELAQRKIKMNASIDSDFELWKKSKGF